VLRRLENVLASSERIRSMQRHPLPDLSFGLIVVPHDDVDVESISQSRTEEIRLSLCAAPSESVIRIEIAVDVGGDEADARSHVPQLFRVFT